MPSAAKLIDELGDAEITSSSELREFGKNLRDFCRDLAWTLDYQADWIEAQLSTLPVADGRFGRLSSRVRAKSVAWCFRAGADAVQHAGKLGLKSWALFCKYFAPELAMNKNKKKPKFKIDT
jgi:hypothetical protein